MRRAVWLHWLLAGYLWLIEGVPLGDWNRQPGKRLIPAMLAGQGIAAGDLAMLAFVTLPAVLFSLATRRRSLSIGLAALTFDAVWLALQIQSWWVPYLFGTSVRWQLEYAKGPATKILPSFGNHVAPDAMHLAIHVLLVAAIVAGVQGLRRLRRGIE